MKTLFQNVSHLGGAGRGGGVGGPGFARRQRTSMRARPGETAALRCRVLNLADRAVSWIRSSDLQILTHAGTVFTADSRVTAITGQAEDGGAEPSAEEGEGWEGADVYDQTWESSGSKGEETVHTLRIERLRPSDSGRYECQINTEPKMSMFFNLTVTDSSLPEVVVRALGPRQVTAPAGGAAELACEAHYATKRGAALGALPPLRIRWHHGGRALDSERARGGVSLEAERWAGGARSRLTLAALGTEHSGRWRCSVFSASDTLTLRVQTDSESDMEAMQRDQAVARVSNGAHSQRTRLAYSLPLARSLLLAALTVWHLLAPT
ncbi:unnamed protein product, partial [Iphiclides podalirius]